MSTLYTFERFLEECKSLTVALLTSESPSSSHLSNCDLIILGDDDPQTDFLPRELQSYLFISFSKQKSD